MGLYITIEKQTDATENNGDYLRDEFYYWRKFGELQNLMEDIWRRDPNNANKDFNCVDVLLTEDICQEVIDKLNHVEELPECHGFFYGQPNIENDEYIMEAIRVWKDALMEVKEGSILYYNGNF